MASIEDIRTSIINDPRNARFTDEGWKPVFSAPSTAVITIVGQTPSADAQRSGLCWDDRSGDRLREWLGVDRETFYGSGLFALVPMDFYFLGDGEDGHRDTPRPWVAPQWHPQINADLPHVQLTILAGEDAQRYYLHQNTEARETQTVEHFEQYLPEFFPIVHPSGRTNIWRTEHPWFDERVIPALRTRVHGIIDARQ
ncbi:uracil-DNA glycosylase family protein [Bifidobacterium pseudolongum]|uniref:uracil-DNA glycosylase family protein n=1 Tax=Bifidobacterium pseudolongum TaxID=1694 RepID=UPI0022E3BBF2|nr:uracil-DNA glycosylase family protein [Bifidobacterium pseudolongum]